jgi:hypothetical protein
MNVQRKREDVVAWQQCMKYWVNEKMVCVVQAVSRLLLFLTRAINFDSGDAAATGKQGLAYSSPTPASFATRAEKVATSIGSCRRETESCRKKWKLRIDFCRDVSIYGSDKVTYQKMS